MKDTYTQILLVLSSLICEITKIPCESKADYTAVQINLGRIQAMKDILDIVVKEMRFEEIRRIARAGGSSRKPATDTRARRSPAKRGT